MIRSWLERKNISFQKLFLSLFSLLTIIAATGILSEPGALLIFFTITIFSVALFPCSLLNLLLFCTPFVLGPSKNDFFIYYDLLVLIVILNYFFLYRKKKRFRDLFVINDTISLMVLFFFISSSLSLPLDLRHFSYFIRTQSLVNIFKDFLLSCEETPMFWVRVLFNRITVLLIFFIARDTFSQKERVTEHIKLTGRQALVIIPFALLIFKDIVPHILYNFTTIQLVGALGIVEGVSAMSGLAYNPGYWGQYLAIFAPVICLWAIKSSSKEKSAAFITVILLVISIPLTRQRGPILAICMSIFFSVFSSLFIKHKKTSRVLIASCLISLLFLVILTTFDIMLLKGFCTQRIFSRSFSSSYRRDIWQVAVEMYNNYKISGIGIGKFHYLFPMFCQKTTVAWEGAILYVRSTAHNLYFHILAEQGAIGLSAILFLALSLLRSVFCLENKENQFAAVFFGASLVSFFTFSLTQYMFYIRGIEILFWSYAGLISSFSLNVQNKNIINRKKILLALLVAGTIFLIRVKDIIEFQLP